MQIPQRAQRVGGEAAEDIAQRFGIGERARRLDQQDDAAALGKRHGLTQKVPRCGDGAVVCRRAQAQIRHAQALHGGDDPLQLGQRLVLLRGNADVGAEVDAGDLQAQRDEAVIDRGGRLAAEIVQTVQLDAGKAVGRGDVKAAVEAVFAPVVRGKGELHSCASS